MSAVAAKKAVKAQRAIQAQEKRLARVQKLVTDSGGLWHAGCAGAAIQEYISAGRGKAAALVTEYLQLEAGRGIHENQNVEG